MSNALRSTIVIAAVWLILISVGGWYVYHKQVEDINKLEKEQEEARSEHQQMQSKVNTLPMLRASLAQLNAKWGEREKIIPAEENARLTYDYFNYISKQTGSQLMYDFSMLSESPDDDVPERVYQLKGEDSFTNLFNFIYYLENNPLLYKIDMLSAESAVIGENDEGDILGVKFEMHVKVYHNVASSLDTAFSPRAVADPPRLIDPFYPLILEKLPENVTDLIDVEHSKLQALTGDTAFIIDQKGDLRALKAGDKVYLGYLTRIDVSNNECVFTLNKGGIIDKVTLGMNFKDAKDGIR